MPSTLAKEMARMEREIARLKDQIAANAANMETDKQRQLASRDMSVRCIPLPLPAQDTLDRDSMACFMAMDDQYHQMLLDKLADDPSLWDDELFMEAYVTGLPKQSSPPTNEKPHGDNGKSKPDIIDLTGEKTHLRGGSWVDHPFCSIRYGGPRWKYDTCRMSPDAKEPTIITCKPCKDMREWCSYNTDDPKMISPCSYCNQHQLYCLSSKRGYGPLHGING